MDNARLFMYESECRSIIAWTSQFTDQETGGDLYGTFTHGNMPLVWLASGPGPRAKRNRVHFEQDTAFTSKMERTLQQQFGLQYIGSWHSHHNLGLREPSSGDREAARAYANNHHRDRTLEVIATYEGNRVCLWSYFYPNARVGGLVPAELISLATESPVRARLGPEEQQYFGSSMWRSAPQFEPVPLTSPEWNLTDQASPQPGPNSVEIPDQLQQEVEAVADQLVDVDMDRSAFRVTLTPVPGLLLRVTIDLRNLNITGLEISSVQGGAPRDVTKVAKQARLPMSVGTHGGGSLARLVEEMPRVLMAKGLITQTV